MTAESTENPGFLKTMVTTFLPLSFTFIGGWRGIRSYRETSPAERAAGKQIRTSLIEKKVEEGGLAPATFAVRVALGVLIFLGVIGLNYALFRWLFETDYLSWYLANGAIISLVFAIISAAAGLDNVPDLISPNPWNVLAGVFLLISLVSAGWAAAFRVRSPLERVMRGEDVDPESIRPLGWPSETAWLLDGLLAAIFHQILVLLILGWLIVVMPIQYFVYLVCGSPARLALSAGDQAAYDPKSRTITLDYPIGVELPGDVVRLGYGARPVTFTASVAAGALWVISQFV